MGALCSLLVIVLRRRGLIGDRLLTIHQFFAQTFFRREISGRFAEVCCEGEHRRQLGVDARRPLRAGQLRSRVASFHVSIFMSRCKISASDASVYRADRSVGVAAELQVYFRNFVEDRPGRNELAQRFRRCVRRCFRLSLRQRRSALNLLSLLSVDECCAAEW